MPWQPGHLPITLRLPVNNCNLLSSLASSTDDRDVRAGVGMDSWLLETSPGNICKQRTIERLSTFALKPKIECNNTLQHWRAGQTSANGRGWRTDYSSLAITFDDIGKQRRRNGSQASCKPTIEPDGRYSMLESWRDVR